MKRLIYSESALADLRSIRNYIANDNLDAAVKMGEGFIKQCELIAKYPDIGTGVSKATDTLRMFTYRGYAIYYDNLEHSVEILRVLHPALDISQQKLR